MPITELCAKPACTCALAIFWLALLHTSMIVASKQYKQTEFWQFLRFVLRTRFYYYMHCVSYLDYRKGQRYLSNLFTHGYVLTTLRIFYNMLKSHIRISYGIHHMVILLLFDYLVSWHYKKNYCHISILCIFRYWYEKVFNGFIV